MKSCALLVAVVLATTSTGCVSYFAQNKYRVKPQWVVGALVLEVGAGSLFGVALNNVNDDHPDDTQLGLPAWIAIGNLVVFAVDGLAAVVTRFADD